MKKIIKKEEFIVQRKSSKSYEESLNTDFYKVNITDVAKVELYEIYFYISYY